MKALPRSYRTRGLTAKIAAHCDVLWIDRPAELTAISSAAIVGKRADQLITGRDKRLQACVSTRARRLNAQPVLTAVVFSSRDCNSVGAARCGIDGQSGRARSAVERRGDHGGGRCLHLNSADGESARIRTGWYDDAGGNGCSGVAAGDCNRCRCLRDRG